MALSKNAHIRAQPSPYRAAVWQCRDGVTMYVLLAACSTAGVSSISVPTRAQTRL